MIFGATYQSAIADSALTTIFGKPKSNQHVELLNATNECLDLAMKSIKVGAHLGIIGDTIYNHVRNKYSLVTDYGGHRIRLGFTTCSTICK